MGIAQLVGMTRYDFLMHWRRRSLLVATFSLLGLNLVILLILGKSMEQYLAQFGTLDPNAPTNIVPFFWIPIYFVILVLFGPIMAEVIPIDHNVGIRELLNSLPLKRETYLGGKLLGMFLAVMSGLLIGAIMLGVVAWIVFGGFDVPRYVQMWLAGAIPVALLNTGLSLLLAAGQPTRRRAAAIGGGFAVLCLAMFTSATNTMLYGESNVLIDSLNPARPAILRFFMPADTNGATVSMLYGTAAGKDVILALVVGLAELLVAGIVIWWWLCWRESRV